MSVAVDVSTIEYTGDGSAPDFDTTFPFEKTTDLTVTVAGVTQVLGVDYSVTGGNFDVGSVSFLLTPPALGALVIITRNVHFTQPTAFRTQGPFTPTRHENAFDRLTYQTQELERRVAAIESGANTNPATAGDGLQNVAGTWKVKAADTSINVAPGGVSVGYGAGGAMAQVTKAAANAGASPLAARIDHKHDALTAAAGTAANGTAAGAEGAATSFARSDHAHAFPAPAAPPSVNRTGAAAGASAKFAREDHSHNVDSAGTAPQDVAAGAAAGTATSFSREDHAHAHANQLGGALHALASSAAHGFMDKADKVKLDGMLQTASNNLQTVDATPATLNFIGLAVPANETIVVEAYVAALRSDAVQGAGYFLQGVYRNQAGTLHLIGAVVQTVIGEDNAAWDATLVISGLGVRVQVTGVAATTINWVAQIRWLLAP